METSPVWMGSFPLNFQGGLGPAVLALVFPASIWGYKYCTCLTELLKGLHEGNVHLALCMHRMCHTDAVVGVL